MSEPTPMTVVIVAHGRPELLARTLASLAACALPASYRRCIVIENGRRCGVEEVVRDAAPHLCASYDFAENPAKAASLNEAARKAPDDWLVFFDDDVRLDPAVLTSYAEAFARHPHGHYFGGWTGVDRETEPPHWLVPFLPASATGSDSSTDDRDMTPCRYCLGFNWAARAGDILACGGFEERLGPGTPMMIGEESLLQQQLDQRRISGLNLASAKVWHLVPAARGTPQFALRRARPGGYTRALLSADDAAAGIAVPARCATWWGDALWVFRRRTLKAFKTRPSSLPFALRYQWLRIDGFRLAVRELKSGQWPNLTSRSRTSQMGGNTEPALERLPR